MRKLKSQCDIQTPEGKVTYLNGCLLYTSAALCYQGEGQRLPVEAVTYGTAQDEWGQARELFDALRKLDERKFSLVYARCPKQEGVGLALYNRLIRAAGFEVISLD